MTSTDSDRLLKRIRARVERDFRVALQAGPAGARMRKDAEDELGAIDRALDALKRDDPRFDFQPTNQEA